MKKLLPILCLATLTVFYSCKGKNKEAKETPTTEQPTAEKPADQPAAPDPVNSNTPLSYSVVFSPDTLLMGKDKKFYIQILEGSGLVKQDPDGKAIGTELSIKLRGTNRNFVSATNAESYSIYQPDQRLELDNGTSITCKSLNEINPEKESSKEGEMIFDLPANTKPVKLNLYEYYSKTRYSVAVSVAEKK